MREEEMKNVVLASDKIKPFINCSDIVKIIYVENKICILAPTTTKAHKYKV